MNELNPVAKWMYRKAVSSDIIKAFVGKHPTRNVYQFYEEIAFEGAKFPYAVFQVYGMPTNDLRSEGEKVLSHQLYQVKFYHEGYDFGVFEDVSNEIEPLFCKSQIEAAGFEDDIVAGCSELRTLKGADPIEGVNRIYMGSLLEITAYADRNN